MWASISSPTRACRFGISAERVWLTAPWRRRLSPPTTRSGRDPRHRAATTPGVAARIYVTRRYRHVSSNNVNNIMTSISSPRCQLCTIIAGNDTGKNTSSRPNIRERAATASAASASRTITMRRGAFARAGAGALTSLPPLQNGPTRFPSPPPCSTPEAPGSGNLATPVRDSI